MESLFERTQRFDGQYEEFLKNPLVEEYLRCELAICRMLQQIAGKVVESVELDLDEVKKVREQLPLLKHRRGDIYKLSQIK